jgi:hypothetical protein
LKTIKNNTNKLNLKTSSVEIYKRMKGVNAIETTKDPVKDGFGGVNNSFAKDISTFSLEYFNNDYQAINSETPFASVEISSHAANNSSALYNGNIRYMQTRLTHPNTRAAMPMLNAYQYDQLYQA